VIVGITGAAATRPPGSKPMSARTASTRPAWSRGRDLFQRQARETDAKKREALIHQIQASSTTA